MYTTCEHTNFGLTFAPENVTEIADPEVDPGDVKLGGCNTQIRAKEQICQRQQIF